MNIFTWVINKVRGSTGTKTKKLAIEDYIPEALADEVYIRELAFWTCVNKIANALTKCEFKTYVKNKEVKEKEYYIWNVEPNKNQNAAAFLTKLIGTLYRNNEALVIEEKGELYVANSFSKEEKALLEYEFTNVTVDNFTFQKKYYQSQVLYFTLNSENVRSLLNGMYESYKTLMTYAMKSYQKSRGSRGILNIDAMAESKDNFSETFTDLMSKHFKKFFDSENAVLPLFDGYSYTDLSQSSKTYSTESTRDIKALADDIFDFTARALSFPPSLAKGDVQDTSKATEELLTFCLDPLARILEKEINRKRYGLSGFQNGNRVRIDTRAVKHYDLFDIATPVDKLISSGLFTINDILKIMGEPEIEEEWAKQHFITKNYATIQEVLKGIDNTQGGGAE